MNSLYMGFDIGGSTTRCTVLTEDGQRSGHALGGPANRVTISAQRIEAEIGAAVRSALAGRPPSLVAGVCIGAAGVDPALAHQAPAAAKVYVDALRRAGVEAPTDVMSDLSIAFASATPGEDGCLLLCGTGAVAARLQERRIKRVVDGHGYQFGDEGSGYWIGRQAIKHALRALDGRVKTDSLASTVAATIRDLPDGGTYDTWAFAESARLMAPRHVAEVARQVMESASAGEVEAREIVRRAVVKLVQTLDALRFTSKDPVVLSGSLLTQNTPLRAGVQLELRARGLTRILPGGDAAAAAAWMALINSRECDPQDTWTRAVLRQATS